MLVKMWIKRKKPTKKLKHKVSAEALETPILLAEACENRTHPPQDHYGANWI